MELWMSGEVQDDVYDQYGAARRVNETIVNAKRGERTYGSGAKEWAYIAMIFGKKGPPE